MGNHFQGLEALPSHERTVFERYGCGLDIPPPFSLLHKAFENIVDSQPLDVALEHDGKSLTYADLDRSANRLANTLISEGLQPGQQVCLVAQRSTYMVTAILAILKCGCQYVPLDGGVVPEQLLSHIIQHTQGTFILCLQRHLTKVEHCGHGQRIIVLDQENTKSDLASPVRPEVDTPASSGAYVIFTSGQWEILGTLLNGGTLLLRTSDWNAVLKRAHTIISTPSILETLRKEEYPNIKTVALAGEPCPKPLAEEWSRDVTFHNCCGPTEVTIVNTIQHHTPGRQLSIGKPIPNTNVYILDENENPLPVGSIGTMWAGGRCVSRGSLMFNTGDLGRWLEDGTLEHHGRLDDQVKIKGFRVELDGVSTAIEKAPGIHKACAILHENVLWGFYSSPNFIDESAVKAVVKAHQPYYAVPEKFVFLPSLPLTPNGKTDRNALTTSIPALAEIDPIKEKGTISLAVPEKCLMATPANSFTSKSESSTSRTSLDKYALPEKKGRHVIRSVRHRVFSLYRRLFSLVFIANMSIVIFILVSPSRRNLPHLASAIASNLTASVLFRQDHVINLLFTIACSVPLRISNVAPDIHYRGHHPTFADFHSSASGNLPP
ncbi:hypothetical protein G7Y89_g8138 [Cudoniella acicularis]|uniref:AMP-dependent synthetase/ligase domain-containing protein n=1 Tax=Cudoniella acicularis TaxID=354080 RepID=A0A8H4RJX4_9HELO|nr:hypothetical protein G7Y89_g8138 [Cudoniella acicularis]